MSRRRMTWNRNASAAPAMPGYQEPSIHPAAYPDPDADAYMNGDPSSWAEDPHPGPYPNSPPPPALPGQQGPEGHPATDPAHYFPKAASRQLRAAMQHKAAKCIRIAQSMLGRKASVSAIEDQALDLMNLSDRQIQAALSRLAMHPMAEMPEMLANMTLTPDVGPMGGDEDADLDEVLLADMLENEGLMADDMMVVEEPMMAAMHFAAEEPAEDEADEADKAEKKARQLMQHAARLRAAKKSEEVEETEEEVVEEPAKKAAHFKRLAAFWAKKAAADSPAPYDQMPGSQNAPEHYNFRSEGVLAAAKAAKKADPEAEELLAAMEAEEAEGKSPKKAKKAEEPAAEKDADAEDTEGKTANYLAGEDPLSDLMGEDGDDLSMADDLAAIYGMKYAKKSEEGEGVEAEGEGDEPTASKKAKKADEDEDEGDEEEVEETEEVEEEPAKKEAALRPQPRKASNGVRSLGAVAKVASSEINDLAKLWESAPDVSKIFG